MMIKIRLLSAWIYLLTLTQAVGQATGPHQFTGLSSLPDKSIEISLSGSIDSLFRNYFELYPLEVSPNLVDWRPLVTLVRTNRSTNILNYTDLEAANANQRFYRTPTNRLVTPIPPPKGPYPVGTVSRLFTDPSRTNRYNINTNSSFMVQFWYAAEPKAGQLPALYFDRRIAAILSSGLGGNATLKQNAVSYALPNVPMATNQARFPIVIFSHGYQLVRTSDTDVMENLASLGYIAVALDHADALASVFPNGKIVQGNAPDLPISPERNGTFLRGRTRDVRFILDELSRMDQEDDFFRGRLDLEHIGIFGHSFGGAIAADSCAADIRFKAGLSLDGGGHTNLLALQISQPFLIASGDDTNPVMPPYRAAFRSWFNQLPRNAYWFRLRNSEHYDFVDSPWFDVSPAPSKLRTATILRTYILSFFNKYLQGQDDHFLDGPPAAYPEVDGFLKK